MRERKQMLIQKQEFGATAAKCAAVRKNTVAETRIERNPRKPALPLFAQRTAASPHPALRATLSHRRGVGRGTQTRFIRHLSGARSAFTIVEILVVVVIIAALATMVVPRLFGKVGTAKQAIAKQKI